MGSDRRDEPEVRSNPGTESGRHEIKLGLRRAGNAREEVIGALDEEDIARL